MLTQNRPAVIVRLSQLFEKSIDVLEVTITIQITFPHCSSCLNTSPTDNFLRRAAVYSEGEHRTIVVQGFKTARVIGCYWEAVGRFLQTNDRDQLTLFEGQAVVDVAGREHPFETRPNVLYRLSAEA